MPALEVEFIKALQKTLNLAAEKQNTIIQALAVGGLYNEAGCFEYLETLSQFIQAGVKMAWICQLSFGESSSVIAEKTLSDNTIKN
jgi:type II secretory pathway component PulF